MSQFSSKEVRVPEPTGAVPVDPSLGGTASAKLDSLVVPEKSNAELRQEMEECRKEGEKWGKVDQVLGWGESGVQVLYDTMQYCAVCVPIYNGAFAAANMASRPIASLLCRYWLAVESGTFVKTLQSAAKNLGSHFLSENPPTFDEAINKVVEDGNEARLQSAQIAAGAMVASGVASKVVSYLGGQMALTSAGSGMVGAGAGASASLTSSLSSMGERYIDAVYEFSEQFGNLPNDEDKKLLWNQFARTRGLDLKEMLSDAAWSTLEGAVAGHVGGRLGAGGVRGLLKPISELGDSAADFSIGLAAVLSRAKLSGQELSAEEFRDSLKNCLTSAIQGRFSHELTKQRTAGLNHKLDLGPIVTKGDLERLIKKGIIQHPTEILDERTKLPTRAVINSKTALSKISQDIPGEKVFVGLDFNNMGPANKKIAGELFAPENPKGYGHMSEEVNKLLASIKKAAKKTLGSDAVLVRMGGDELGIIIGHDSKNPRETLEKVASFVNAVEDYRDSIFKMSDPRVKAAELLSLVRREMRKVFQEVKTEMQDDFGHDGYFRILEQKLAKEGYSQDEIAAIKESSKNSNNSRLSSGDLVLAIARRRIEKRGINVDERPVSIMGLSVGAVKVGRDLDPQTMYRAIAETDRQIHDAKEGKGTLTSIGSIPDSIVLRASDEEAILGTEKVEKLYSDALNELKSAEYEVSSVKNKFIKACCTDPSSSGNLRYGLVSPFRAKDVFSLSEPKKMLFIEPDITAFGAINNQLGSTRADELFRKFANIAKEHFDTEVRIRDSGGGLIIVVNNRAKFDDLNSTIEAMRHQMNELLAKELGREAKGNYRVFAEYELRRSLAAALEDSSESERGYGTVQIRMSEVEVRPHDTVGKVLGEVKKGFKIVKPTDLTGSPEFNGN